VSATQISADDADVSPAPGKGRRPPRRRRRRAAAVVVVVLVAAGAGIVVADPFGARTTDAPAESTSPTGLAQVARGTLSARTQESGTLGYGGDYQVVNKAGGTVTKLPDVGDLIGQGKVLYRVDGKSVVLLQGGVPAYRDLDWGMEGADVRQLNAALVALKYATRDEIDPDSDYFGRQTYNALRKLQEDVGLTETGRLPLGQAVFVPTREIRITKVNATLGGSASAGAMFLQASSTQRYVAVSLNASQQSTVAVGNKVTISLPNGKTTPGVVSSVGKVATQEDDKTTIEVHITPSKPAETGKLDRAPVLVSIVSETVQNVLSVPVNGLLAMAGGGYAIEVVEAGGTHRLISVTTGLFDSSVGKVEVTGDGLAAGQNIVVPAS
jgi:hypothetical protein